MSEEWRSPSDRGTPIPNLESIREAARTALALIDADDLPDDELSNTAQIAISREPKSRIIRHPSVIAAADPVRHYPALSVRCRCRHRLGYVALIPMTTGMFLVHSDRLQPKRSLRHGGYTDLAPVGNTSSEMFTLAPWNDQLPRGIGAVRATSPLGGLFGPDTPGVMFDAAARVTYTCPECHAEFPLRNDALVRRFLQAVADGDSELRLGAASDTSARPGAARGRDQDGSLSRRTSSRRK